ncbi:hypothetical protein CXF83_08585 [Shewanella sp. Choline-02u-19]|jgi:microcystin-dependent protein|uniref:phage tail protein n=1 Tax=unclassified Shewanella TaxID=196818 RepID=UPI000C32E6D6|nr:MULTISPECIES: tail fiber protein [unclassified Shewanella]PKG58749.1 hypothetical protein CXF82_02955 [Shewanella sp. GutDb-MelDb]PKH55797.1 hypothetical protein CXF84_17105 [Shewanella sp. Bg11-22]PKI26789.1 hypothetical protein CXF83_08585 [Shewanella sp. Choline-02u-19]
MEIMLGTSMIFAGNFVPRGWVGCNGQMLSISDNQAIFSVLSNTYGGDARTTFGIPDLRGRAPVGTGRGPGAQVTVNLGDKLGRDTIALDLQHMPTHNHSASFNPQTSPGSKLSATATTTVNAANGKGSQDDAEGAYWATPQNGSRPATDSYAGTKTTRMASDAVEVDVQITGSGAGITGGTVTVENNGSSVPFPVWQPTLGLQYIMSITGIYPSRN